MTIAPRASGMASARLGIDTGGTFTDLATVNSATGAVTFTKVLSTPEDSSIGVLHAAQKGGIGFADLDFFIHGTTIGTNAVLERKGALVGLLTTRGFRDVLEIARTDRPEVYGLRQDKFGEGQIDHLVPRYLRLEVDERLRHDGSIERPLDEGSVRSALQALQREGVQAVAVSLINSYANAEHETAIRRLVEGAAPELPLSLSSIICPEAREYERTSTTVVNAYLIPVVAGYLRHLLEAIRREGYRRTDFFVMSSSGGVMDSSSACSQPIATLESGPAAGVIAATMVAAQLGLPNLISFDMGGTTAKAGLVEQGQPRPAGGFKVATTFGHILRRGPGGGGYAVNTPIVDLAEVGVGGGSIAWLDAGGSLKVGPRSAGAQPGPACYGRGGLEPTVTDADVVLGRVNPRYFAGGEIALDVEASRRAFQERLGDATGMSVVDLAAGVVEVADEGMMRAIRAVSVERGYDPRDYAMIAFGSAAPQHAARIAEELDVSKVVIPNAPGCMSAFGLLVARLRYDFARAMVVPLSDVEPSMLGEAVEHLRSQGVSRLRAQTGATDAALSVSVDLRYEGQSWELNVPVLLARVFDAAAIERIRSDFAESHRTHYGYHLERGVLILVNLRVSVAVEQPPFPSVSLADGGVTPPAAALKAERQALLSTRDGFRATPVYDRAFLLGGNAIEGPALVEELQSTTVVPHDWKLLVDPRGHLVMEPR